jgi:hypothetical protein
MKKFLLVVLALIATTGFPVALADKKADSVTVSGWLAEIDPPAHTFAIRNGKKLLQFTTIPSRTNITGEDWGTLRVSLSSARVGDAVMVKLSLAESHPYVESVKFTHRPATATPIKTRPGFVLSPYSHSVFDVRKCAHGEMLEDPWPGKIFLVP